MVFNNLIFYCKSAFVLCSGSQQGSAVTSYSTYPKCFLDLHFFSFQWAENSAVSQDLGFHIAPPQKQIPQMSSFAELAKMGPISLMRLQAWYQNTPPFDVQCLLIVKFGANYKIQVQFQPLVRTLPREGKFQLGAWAWVLSVKFPTEQQCPTDVSRSSVQFLSWRYKLHHLMPQAAQGFLFIQLEWCKCRWEDNT